MALLKNDILTINLVKEHLKKRIDPKAIKVIAVFQKKRKPIKDEELAKKSKLKVTEIRTILNKMHYNGFVEYKKRKDKNSGWYHYTWNLNKKRIIETLIEKEKEELRKLNEKKKMTENYSFFACQNGCVELPFEIAAEYNFKCPECGKNTEYVDLKKHSKILTRNINTLNKQIEKLKNLVK